MAGLVSAVAALTAAVVVASFTAEVNTRNIKVKAAWDALAKKQWDKDYLKAREIYLRLVEKNTAFSKYAVATGVFDDDFSQEFEAVMNIANDYEIMAIGIEKHVLDESVIQASFRTAWINDYNKLAPFFNSVRDQSGNDRYFCQFEKVTRRWSRSKPPK